MSRLAKREVKMVISKVYVTARCYCRSHSTSLAVVRSPDTEISRCRLAPRRQSDSHFMLAVITATINFLAHRLGHCSRTPLQQTSSGHVE
jgi:hypothetical protein